MVTTDTLQAIGADMRGPLRRRACAASGVAVAVAGIVVGVGAGPAFAQDYCYYGNYCTYTGVYAGYVGQWGGSNPNLPGNPRRPPCPQGTWNDCTTSWFNTKANCTMAMYRDTYYGGGGYFAVADPGNGSNAGPSGRFDGTGNDKILSSFRCLQELA